VEFFAMPMNCAIPLEISKQFQSHWGEPCLETDHCLQNLKSFGKFCSERLTRCKSKCNFSFISLGGIILCNWTYSKYTFAKSQQYSMYKCIQKYHSWTPKWRVPANDLRKLNYRVHESVEKWICNLSSSWMDCSLFTAPNAWYVTEFKLYGLETVLSLSDMIQQTPGKGNQTWHYLY
jgi:hypothetical protein